MTNNDDGLARCIGCGEWYLEAENIDGVCKYHYGEIYDFDRVNLQKESAYGRGGISGDFWNCCMRMIKDGDFAVEGCTIGKHTTDAAELKREKESLRATCKEKKGDLSVWWALSNKERAEYSNLSLESSRSFWASGAHTKDEIARFYEECARRDAEFLANRRPDIRDEDNLTPDEDGKPIVDLDKQDTLKSIETAPKGEEEKNANKKLRGRKARRTRLQKRSRS